MSSLKLNNANISYKGVSVLNDISVEISSGETVAIVGESGVGKTSLLRLLRNQVPDASAWCPQEKGLVPNLSAFHNIYSGLLDQHSTFTNILNFFWPQKNALSVISAVAEELDIDEYLNQQIKNLSGGQKQRVAIARAMIQGKEVFIGDEPVSAVDEFMAKQIIQKIKQRHQTTILALHDVDMALNFCNRIIGLKDGAIALDGYSKDLQRGDLYFLYPHERL